MNNAAKGLILTTVGAFIGTGCLGDAKKTTVDGELNRKAPDHTLCDYAPKISEEYRLENYPNCTSLSTESTCFDTTGASFDTSGLKDEPYTLITEEEDGSVTITQKTFDGGIIADASGQADHPINLSKFIDAPLGVVKNSDDGRCEFDQFSLAINNK